MSLLEVNHRIAIPIAEFQFSYTRSGGPGGQNVNKVNSKVILRWPILTSTSLPDDVRARFVTQFGTRITREGDLLIVSQRFRDQERNEADCLEKLREMLLGVAVPPKKRRPTKPTRGSKERRLQNKTRQGSKKRDRRWSGD